MRTELSATNGGDEVKSRRASEARLLLLRDEGAFLVEAGRSSDPRVESLLRRLYVIARSVSTLLRRQDALTTLSTAGMCLQTSALVTESLVSSGEPATILQGEVADEDEPNSWIEHHVTLIQLSDVWISVDFTANQFRRYRDSIAVVLVASPAAFRDLIKSSYGWWVRP
jgi:hypothetical protein